MREDIANGPMSTWIGATGIYETLCSWMGTDLASMGVGKFNLVMVLKVHWGDGRKNGCSIWSNVLTQVEGEEAAL